MPWLCWWQFASKGISRPFHLFDSASFFLVTTLDVWNILELPEVPGPAAFLVQAGAKDMPPPETTLNGTNGTTGTKEAEHATRAENGKDQGAAENHPRLAITCYDLPRSGSLTPQLQNVAEI